MKIKFNVLTNSQFWKVICDLILRLGELIKLIIIDKNDNDDNVDVEE